MLEVTSPALGKLKEVMEQQGQESATLRVIAVPAENGGVQYMLTMEQEPDKDDTIMNVDGVRFLVDSDSAPFLEDATIDYVEELTRVDFVINNPMYATGGCGNCGCGAGGCGSH